MKIRYSIRVAIATVSIIIPFSTYIKSKLDRNKASMLKQTKNRVVSLDQAMRGFSSYMDLFIDHYHLPRTTEEKERDQQDTWFALEYHSMGEADSALVPFAKLLDLKRAYKYMLQLRYPENFKKVTKRMNIITRRMVKKSIKALVLNKVKDKGSIEALAEWKRIKHECVNHQLDNVTFTDDNGELVMTHDAAQTVTKATAEYMKIFI